jgi:O-antigen ligase
MNNRAKQKRANRRPKHASRQHDLGFWLQRIQQALCAIFIFSLPSLLFLGNTEYGYTKTIFAYLMVAVLYLLWAVQAWHQNEWRFHVPGLLWPALGLIIAGALSLINAVSPGIVFQSLGVLSYFILFYIYIANQTWNRKILHLYVGAGVLAAFLTSIYGLFQFNGLLPGLVGQPDGKHAMLSGLGNKNFLAELLAIWVMPSLLLLLGFKNIWAKIAVLAVHTVNFSVFILADSTGALLGFIAGALVLTIGSLIWRSAFHQVWNQKIWFGVWILLILIPFLMFEPPDTLKDIFSQASQVDVADVEPDIHTAALFQNPVDAVGSLLSKYWEAGSGNVRTWDWLVAIEMFNANPVFGIGLGHYKVLFVEYKAKFLETERGKDFNFYISRAAQAHNDYIQAAAEMGLMGIAAIVFAFITLIWKVFRHLFQIRDSKQLFALLLYASAAVFFVDAVVNFPAHLAASAFSVVLLLGLAHGAWGFPAKQVRAKGWAARVLVIAIVLINLGVNVFAYRDWQANVYLDDGINQINTNLYNLARDSLERSLALDFQPAEVLYRLGYVYQQLGDLEQAEVFYERSMKSFLVDGVYYPLAVLKVNKGAYAEAEALLDILLLTQPQDTLVMESELLRANIQLRQQDFEAAESQLRQLKETFNKPKVWFWLAQSLLAQGKGQEGVELLQNALSRVEQNIIRFEKQLTALDGQEVAVQKAVSLQNTYQFNVRLREQILEVLASLGL